MVLMSGSSGWRYSGRLVVRSGRFGALPRRARWTLRQQNA